MFASYHGSHKPSKPITSRRKVFDNAMVAHVWAQQSNSEGRSSNGNFYFEGATIYSYGSHFPIATFTDATFGDKRVVLFNYESRSVSTGQHQRYTQAALDGLPVKIFSVPSVAPRWGNANHVDNVAHLVKTFDAYAARMARAHVKNWSTDRDRSTYADLGPAEVETARLVSLTPMAQDIRDYCATFGLECPDLGLAAKGEAIAKAFARRNDPKQVAKREAANKAKGVAHWRVASRVAAFFEGVTDSKPNLHFISYRAKSDIAAEYEITTHTLERRVDALANQYEAARKPPEAKGVTIEQWQNGAKGQITRNAWADSWDMPTLVRRKGDTLETSRGAECPFTHAVIAFLKAQECRRAGKTWHRNGQQIRVGHFNVDLIDAQGNMQAGCHTLEWGEMLRLAIREIPNMVKPSFGLPALLDT